MKYKHNKTGNIYRHLAHGIDCTNSRDGTPVIVYCPENKENTVFTIETKEFNQKFSPL